MAARSVVTIDGLAGSGKTTLSRMLAEKLGFIHLNTGLLYRGTGYLALRAKLDLSNAEAVHAELVRHSLLLDVGPNRGSILRIDGTPFGEELHRPEISEAASKIAGHALVRKALVPAQREAFPGKDLVAEGRDMAGVIFPDAKAKFFIHADPEIRIERRLKQLGSDTTKGGDAADRAKMAIELTQRDERDAASITALAKPSPDAVVIDNSRASLTEVLQTLYAAALKSLGQ